MSKRKKLAPRIRIARAATEGKPAGWRQEVPAFVVRHGLAIHPVVRPSTGVVDSIAYRLTATGCGWSVAVFSDIESAEKGLVRICRLVNWSRATPDTIMKHADRMVRLLKPLGATR